MYTMKVFLSFAALLFTLQVSAQSTAQSQVLTLSNNVFQWEVEDKIDLLDSVFANQFVVVNAAGESQAKAQYLARLRSGSFVHDSIQVEENNAIVSGNTATVFGKGRFVVTSAGNKIRLHLSYMEVFTKPTAKAPWQILAMHASILQH
jgi:Domain of unknown function (DUF4440)